MKNHTQLNGLLFATALTLSTFSPIGSSYASAQESTPAPATTIDTVAPVVNAKVETVDATPALWMVKDEDTTVYLFGTVHVLKPGLSWFDGGLKEAFDKSGQLVMELGDGEDKKAQELFGKFAIDKSGKPLRQKLTDADRSYYDAAMKQLGVPENGFDPLDPWAAGLTMQLMSMTKAGFAPGNGAESILTSAAKQSKKPIIGLETMEYQLGLFDALPETAQIRFLIESAKDLDGGNKMLDELVGHWAAGDPEKLAQVMNEGLSMEPMLADKLLTQRNANWARWINKRMDKPGTIFVAVGAGHLSGTTSVPYLLTAYGLEATRVNH
jgi:uncharacterized protein